jgi:hypothetical protein
VGLAPTTAITLAAVRPDDWDLPLFIHVLAALTVIGALTLAGSFLVSSWRSGSAVAVRLGFRSLLFGVLPAWIVLRGSSEWIADKEGYADLDEPPDWIDIGYIVSDTSFLLILISTLLAWLAVRASRGGGGGGPTVTGRFAAGIVSFLFVIYLVALWAMTTKPA